MAEEVVEDVTVVAEIADVTMIEEVIEEIEDLATEVIDDLLNQEGDLETEVTEDAQMIQRQTEDQDLISIEINALQNLAVLVQKDQDVLADVIKLL